MNQGLKLWNNQGQLRLDTSDRLLKYISKTTYLSNTYSINWVSAGGNAVTPVYMWSVAGLTAVNDTSQNNELFTYAAFDLDISAYIVSNASIIGFVSEVDYRIASSVYGHPIWQTGTVFGGFTKQNGNLLRIYAGYGCYSEPDRSSGLSTLTFKLTLYEY